MQFRRVLSRRDLIVYGLVILSPTAPYPVYGIVQQVSQGHAVLSYLVAMVAMLFTAASYAKMSAAYPSAGSTYTYAQRAFNPYAGFIAGWAMILDYLLIPLVSVIFAALTAAQIAPRVPYFIWTIVFIVGIALINVRGIRVTARASTATMAVMTACALLFIWVVSRFVIQRQGLDGLISIAGVIRPETFSFSPLMLGAAIATLSYIGFDAISTLAEDTVDPVRDIGFATIMVCLLQTIICVVTVYLASLAWPDYRTLPHLETAILDIGQKVGGPWMLACLTFVLLVAALASALTAQAGASRLLMGMGRDRMIPPGIFAYIHPRYLTPSRAIYVMSAASCAGALLMRFQLAVELLNFGAFAGFILVNLSVVQHYFIRLRLRRGTAILSNLVFPMLGAIVCAYVWISLTMAAKLAGFAWLAFGVLYLAVLTRGFRDLPKQLNFKEPTELSR